MPRAQDIDRETRERLRAWFRYFFDQRGETQAEFARFLGIKQSTVSDILNDKKTMGLDVFLKMGNKFRTSLDVLADQWPREAKAPPRAASPASATRGRRKKTAVL